jgi:hypothetical protein
MAGGAFLAGLAGCGVESDEKKLGIAELEGLGISARVTLGGGIDDAGGEARGGF